MPPRLSKRQQRETEELEGLSHVKSQLGETESVLDVARASTQGIGFSALVVASNEHTEEEDQRGTTKTGKKSKKKKKKSGANPSLETSKDTQKSSTVPIRNEKKAAKKAKAKKTKAASDELDQILAELSLQYPSSQKVSQSVTDRPSLADLLGVSLQFLDPEAEMRRFFGSKVVLATKTSESSRGGSKKVQNVRSHLARPQATWWPSQGRDGLSLRSYSETEVSEKLSQQGWSPIQEKWWTVEYSRKYKSVTKGFMSAVMLGDPQVLFDQLRQFPWHADTLLQIAEVYRHREEHALVVDFIERSLFTYERCLMGIFNFTTGFNRLDFDRVENRPFFLALHRQVADLQRRGCVRTSFEFSRLLYGLDPWNDPHGAIFHLEYLAVKANMHQWLLDLYDTFLDQLPKSDARLNPSLLPGWAYARALALKLMEDATKDGIHTKSIMALQEAAHDFPSVVPLLADKLDVALPSNLRAHKDFRIETDNISLSPAAATLHLLSHLYVQRCFPLWKEHASWFSKTISEGFSTLPASLPHSDKRNAFYTLYERPNLRYSVYRHVMVLDAPFRRLFSFIPREIFEGKALACDPLPPPTSSSSYDQVFFHGVDDFHSEHWRRVGNRQGLQQLADPALRQHLQQIIDAHPHLAQQFPGGVDEVAQMMAGLPPDLFEDLMVGGMPGGLDGMDVHDAAFEFNLPAVEENPGLDAVAQEGEEDVRVENEDTDSGDEGDVSLMPRVLRNVIGRVLGRRAAESSSSGEEDPPLDDMGVD